MRTRCDVDQQHQSRRPACSGHSVRAFYTRFPAMALEQLLYWPLSSLLACCLPIQLVVVLSVLHAASEQNSCVTSHHLAKLMAMTVSSTFAGTMAGEAQRALLCDIVSIYCHPYGSRDASIGSSHTCRAASCSSCICTRMATLDAVLCMSAYAP